MDRPERLEPNSAGIARAAELLRAGEVLAVPTDTVYGLIALASRPTAVDLIFQIKNRPLDRRLVVFVADSSQAENLVMVDARARRLMARWWPGPLTIVLPLRDQSPTTLAVRAPDHEFIQLLLQYSGEPLVSTSANLSGAPPALTAAEASLAGVAAVVDGGERGSALASTVADLSGSPITILREGPVSGRDILLEAMASETETTLTLRALDQSDPVVANLIRLEYLRQNRSLELIASENLASPAVLEALGTLLTNKYAEGYPGRRYYGGCGEVIDQIENLAIDRAKELFGAEYVNVQPHAGSQANMAVYMALCQPGDRVMGMDLSQGGHLTHGSPANFSGKLYEIHSYGVDRETELIDYDLLAKQATEVRPKILLGGFSAYPRIIDWERMRHIADAVGAVFWVDMAHVAGLVAAGQYPSPIPHAQIVTTTTQKTLRGAWGGMILCRSEYQKAIDSAVFPGIQGGPLMHAIAAKAVCFGEALKPEFKAYGRRVVENARSLAARLTERGLRLVSGGTDNHLMLVDLRTHGRTGKQVQEAADEVGITLNRNSIPFDDASKFNPSGIRVGTPLVTTRGMGASEMIEIADCLADLIERIDDRPTLDSIRARTLDLTGRFPIPYGMD